MPYCLGDGTCEPGEECGCVGQRPSPHVCGARKVSVADCPYLALPPSARRSAIGRECEGSKLWEAPRPSPAARW
eukprot:scaffold17420_cov129-Isochrysis_galbana.AAC.1